MFALLGFGFALVLVSILLFLSFGMEMLSFRFLQGLRDKNLPKVSVEVLDLNF